MSTEQGSLVLADISGYTAFVAGTELEHSREIVTDLLETILRCFKGRLEVAKLEGDAVFAVSEPTDTRLLRWLDDTFVAFTRRVRDIAAATSCACGACTNVGSLTLKFAVHHGVFSRHRLGEREELVGLDVIVAHRLLKNAVPSREYVLATRPALDRWGDAEHHFTPHRETFEGIGEIQGAYRDLGPLRERALAEERLRVGASEAKLRRHLTFDATSAEVWRALTDGATRRRWSRADTVDVTAGARGTLLGAEYHCSLPGGGGTVVYRVVGADEPHELTTVARMARGAETYETWVLRPAGDRTAVELRVWWARPAGPAGLVAAVTLRVLLPRRYRENERELRAILAERR